jgi:hypothetical protein
MHADRPGAALMLLPTEMQRRATEVSSRRKELEHKRTSLGQERA